MAKFEDHETEIVHQMKLREAVRNGQLLGAQVAAFYLALSENIGQETATLLTHTFIAELLGSCSCQCSDGEDETD